METCVDARERGDQDTLDRLAWFKQACDAKLDEKRPSPRTQLNA